MKVAGKVIVVTGAGNGMGRAISLNLLSKGAKVIGLDINMEGLKKTQELAGNNGDAMKLMQLDITNREAVEQVAEEAVQLFGAVDGIINNAGIIQDSCLIYLLVRRHISSMCQAWVPLLLCLGRLSTVHPKLPSGL